MAVLDIRIYGDPVLRKTCEPVTEITPELLKLADDMIETMYEANGVGLAAPQVGKTIRLTVIDPQDDEETNPNYDYPLVLFNPEVIESEGSDVFEEGCLSIPGVRRNVTRPQRVVVKALDRHNNEIRIEDDQLLARVLQHEIDHLNGVLFIDHLSMIDRLAVEPQLRKLKTSKI